MDIRPLEPEEHAQWLRLRERLWPDCAREDHVREQREMLDDPDRNATLVAAKPDGELVGFAEVAVRDGAAGCSTRPVGYLEGWYVEPAHRRRGVGRELVAAAEHWARSRGCAEMGSDAELPNEVSHRAHRALGYTEVVRIVLYARRLVP